MMLEAKMMATVQWLSNATFFPSAFVFRSLLPCSLFSLFDFFLLYLILPVSLCSSFFVFFFLSVFGFISRSQFFCLCLLLCLFFSSLWPFSGFYKARECPFVCASKGTLVPI
jgi:hypothetical protein